MHKRKCRSQLRAILIKRAVRTLGKQTVEQLGAYLYLVCNAALNPPLGPYSIPMEAFDKIIECKTLGVAHRLCQLVLPAMARKAVVPCDCSRR